MGGNALLDSCKTASDHMKAKGAIGVGLIMLKAHGMVDLVRVIMPDMAGAKKSQKSDDWGREEWVSKSNHDLCALVFIPFLQPNALRFAIDID